MKVFWQRVLKELNDPFVPLFLTYNVVLLSLFEVI